MNFITWDGELVELVYYLGEYSIVNTEDGQELVSSDRLDQEELYEIIRRDTWQYVKNAG